EQAPSRPAALALVAFAFVVVMAGNTLPTPLYVLYQARLGFSDLTLTAIFAAYVIGVLGSLLLAGRLSDETGRRPLLLCGLGASAASALIFLAAPSVASMFLARILSGISAGTFTATATAALTDLSASKKRATLLATVCNIGGLGIGAPLAGALATAFQTDALRAPFLVHLGLLASALVAVLAAPETVRRQGRLRLALRRPGVPAQVRGVFVYATLAGFCGYAVLGLFTALVPSFLAQLLGVSSRVTAGAVVFVAFAASTVAQLTCGPLIAKPRMGVIAGLGMMVLGLMLVVGALLGSSLGLLVAGAVVSGAGQGVGFRAGMAALNEATPEDRRAEVATAFFVTAYVAISIPVIGVGLGADLAGLRPAGVGFGVCVAALALVTMVGLARRPVDRAAQFFRSPRA
ncbi:MAG: MFS transporter, partial [Acidimicrobiia bacterium]